MSPLTAFRQVALPHARAHALRTAITVAGIAFGVAAMVGLRLAYEPIRRSQEQAIANLAGKASIQVTNGDLGVPEELLDEIRDIPGVRLASPSIQGFMPFADRPGDRLYVFGVDLLAADDTHEFEIKVAEGSDDSLVFLSGADSVALTSNLLRDLHLAVGDSVVLLGPQGPTRLTVRAELETGTGPATLFAGRLALMDVFAAQQIFGLDQRFSRIDVMLAPGSEPETVESAIARKVTGRATVEPQRASLENLERVMGFQRHLATLHSLGAVLVGLAVIFNTMTISVVQRRQEIGTMRALGMRRAEVVRLFLFEALFIAAVGCLLGAPLGVILAQFMSLPAVAEMQGVAGIAPPPPALHLEPLLVGCGIGLLSTLGAALLPASQAARTSPLDALRRAPQENDPTRPYAALALAGMLLALATMGVWLARGSLLDVYESALIAYFGVLVAMALSVPLLVRGLLTLGRPLLDKFFGAAGTVASRTLTGNIHRLAITSTFFVICLTYVVAASAAYATLDRTFQRWFEMTFGDAHLVVSAGAPPMAGDSSPLPADLAEELRHVPGVEHVEAIRLSKIRLDGTVVTLMGIDMQARRRSLGLVEGDQTTVRRDLASGRGVVVDEGFTTDFGLHIGDRISLPSSDGIVALPILGVTYGTRASEMSRDPPTVTLDLGHFHTLFRDDRVNLIEITLRSATDAEPVAQAVRAAWGDEYGVFVTRLYDYREGLRTKVRRDLAGIPPILAIALIVAVLGLVNSLLASVLDRLHEIGTLRAIGTTRGQMARAVLLEGAFLGIVSGGLAAMFGTVIGYYEIAVLGKSLSGTTLHYSQPLWTITATFMLAVLMAAAAGYWPGRRAARLVIVDALTRD